MSLPDIKDAGALVEVVRYGTPWHGTVEKVGAVYTLHTGKLDGDGAEVTLPWTAINHIDDGEGYVPRRKFRNPAGVPASTLTAEQIASEALQGREWRDYAVIAGKRNKLWGRDEIELGDDWLYSDASGLVWRVACTMIASSIPANTATFRVVFTRFGELRTDGAAAQTYSYDIALPDAGMGGLTYTVGGLAFYMGDHTETGDKTLLLFSASNAAYGTDRRKPVSIMELVISDAGTAPVISILKNWAALASYTYSFTVIQDDAYYTEPGVEPYGQCGFIYEAERVEACTRIFHAAYSPAGVVEFLAFEKVQTAHITKDNKQGCGPGIDRYDLRSASYRSDCSVKKDGASLFAWYTQIASYFYDTAAVPGVSSVTWTTDLPYTQGVSYDTECIIESYEVFFEPSAEQYADYKLNAMYYMDGLRNRGDGSVDLDGVYARLAVFSVADFYDRQIFPYVCGASYVPPRPVGAKPDDTHAIVLAACPHQADTTLRTATLPDQIFITHKEDETLNFSSSPVAFI